MPSQGCQNAVTRLSEGRHKAVRRPSQGRQKAVSVCLSDAKTRWMDRRIAEAINNYYQVYNRASYQK